MQACSLSSRASLAPPATACRSPRAASAPLRLAARPGRRTAWVAATAAPEAPQSAASSQGAGPRHERRPDDVVIVSGVRTANCRARKGGFKDTFPDDLLVAVLNESLKRANVKPEEVGEVCFGSVFPSEGKRACELRSSLLLAGFPLSVPAYTVNRQCAAGLQSIANVAAGIRAGYYDIAIAGGIESYTTDPLIWEGSDSPRIAESQDAQDVGLPLGLTAENVAELFHVEREAQDRWAAASHAKAAAAQAAGKFEREIVPVETVTKNGDGEAARVTVAADDSIRADTSPDSLAKLKPYFKKDGTVTVGNSCSNTDCAAAVVMMTRGEAKRRGLPIMGTLRSFAAVAVPPAIMGTAPLKAVPKALERAGLSKEDVEVYEINEAFASQFSYCMEQLGIPEEKVNVNGGAIALGHPAGATGARLTVTLLHELARRNGGGTGSQYGLVGLCTGGGMGAAAVFEAEGGENAHLP